MDPFARRPLGRTGVSLPALGLGGAALGNIVEAIPERDADATTEAAWQGGIRYYDTSPWYGRGLSEHRFGRMLRQQPRDEFILSTKVGRLFSPPADPVAFAKSERPWPLGLPFDHRYDYTYDGIMRSFEDSLQRLGLPSIDLLLIHDLDLANLGSEDRLDQHFAELEGGGLRALEELKSAGHIAAYGAGVNRLGTIPRFLGSTDVDFFLVALPYTLAEQPALDDEFPLCEQRGVGIIIGGVFASGILATGPVPGARYNYHPPTPDEADRVRRMDAVCARFGISLAAAALQFPLHHPLVASVIPGAFAPAQVATNIRSMSTEIPDALWSSLKAEGLLRPDAPTP